MPTALDNGQRSPRASLAAAARKLTELFDSVGVLAPPEVVWRAAETGELFLDRQKASEASREAFKAGGSGAD